MLIKSGFKIDTARKKSIRSIISQMKKKGKLVGNATDGFRLNQKEQQPHFDLYAIENNNKEKGEQNN